MTATLLETCPETAPTGAATTPTVWGLSPIQLHDHFWAARGVCVVRLGEPSEITADAELYLLADNKTLTIFRLAPLIDTLSWVNPGVMFLRVLSRQHEGYRETVVTDGDGEFLRFHRLYGGVAPQLSRVAMTRDRRIAAVWQSAGDTRSAWRGLRRQARGVRRETATIKGRVYDRSTDREVNRFVTDLVSLWSHPRATVSGIHKVSTGVWAYGSQNCDPSVKFIGPAWIGAGRKISPGETVLGPAVLWDDPIHSPVAAKVRWADLEPIERMVAQPRTGKPCVAGPPGKRLFDILFAAAVLLFTLPFYPFVMLAIWFEDGRPFFFLHRRQTLGGREFSCIKFRSMRRDADRIKAELAKANQADGPQFFVRSDPRETRVGRFIRKANIDELPQFINVLLGDMSVVGPRPSPSSENQFNPAWREARLSVCAGITGLWQVSRTRRPGLDFQEWIKYDTQYVQNMSWRMDLGIIARTIRILLRG